MYTYPCPYIVVIPLGYIPAPCIYDLVIGSKPRKTVSRRLYRTWFRAPEHVRPAFGNTKTKGLRFFFPSLTLGFYSPESLSPRRTDLLPESTHVIVCVWRTRLNPSEYYYPFKRAPIHPAPSFGARHSVGLRFPRVFVSFPRADNARRTGSKQIENGPKLAGTMTRCDRGRKRHGECTVDLSLRFTGSLVPSDFRLSAKTKNRPVRFDPV